MAINDSRLTVTEFDFDSVKENLKLFLKAQDTFKDYDFEGSGMNILLDVLAYNTHYLGFNANMLANEMFLDSASLRSSVVSHVKSLGYTPISSTAAKATIDVTLNTTRSSATMPAGTAFSTTIDDVNFEFVTIADVTKQRSGNTIVFPSVDIYEGTYVTSRFVVDTSDAEQRFLIPSDLADTSTLSVAVQTSTSDNTSTTFTKSTDISSLSSTSNAFFLQEVENGQFEVYFGDGILGKSLSDGNVVLLSYVVSNLTRGNGASIFAATGAIATVTDISVSTINPSSGGKPRESIASMKFNAPLNYASQGRAVTNDDYKLKVKELYANTRAVQIFGGDEGSFDTSIGVTDTPEFGKVFISIKTTSGNNLTESEKSSLVASLKKFTVASITPVIVDPETLSLILKVSFTFDTGKTSKAISELETIVSNEIRSFNTNKLNTFDAPFRHSEFVADIDNADTSITSVTATANMAKNFTPTLNTATGYTVNFGNAIYNPFSGYNSSGGGSIASTGFFEINDAVNEQFFDEDGDGNIRRYYVQPPATATTTNPAGTRVVVDANAGTVDYQKGVVKINALQITSVGLVDESTSSAIRLTAIPDASNIQPTRNLLLNIDTVNTTINGNVDSVASGTTNTSSTVAQATSYSTTSAY